MKTTRCEMRASTIKTYTSHVDGSRLQLKVKSQYTLGKLKKEIEIMEKGGGGK